MLHKGPHLLWHMYLGCLMDEIVKARPGKRIGGGREDRVRREWRGGQKGEKERWERWEG